MADKEDRRVLSGDSLSPSLIEEMQIADFFLNSNEEIVEITDVATEALRLKRFLSTRSVLSTASSFAVRQQEAQDAPCMSEKIGEGFCAEVFDLPGTGRVVKRARQDPTKTVELWNDFGSHLRIYESLSDQDSADIDISVPRPCYFVTAKDFADWASIHDVLLQDRRRTDNSSRVPELLKEPSAILVSERIMPLPRIIRTALINTFCPESLRQNAMVDVKNNDCLVRVYLGVRRPDPFYHSGDFSLRNFELTLDKMDFLGLDPLQYVAPMAEALAVMHWDAHRDAVDVEFVLGSAPESRITARDFDDMEAQGPGIMRTTWQNPRRMPQDSLDFSRRTVSMWLLDFNQVGRIKMRDTDIDKIVWAFWNNDPYYPRPGETKLWQAFKAAYLSRSARIMDRCPHAQDFIDRVEAEAESRQPASQGPPRVLSSSSKPPAATTGSQKGKKQRKYV